jgi:hypothetical protein
MPHKHQDLPDLEVKDRVRERLTAQLTNNPAAYRTLARLLYAFVSHGYESSMTFPKSKPA